MNVSIDVQVVAELVIVWREVVNIGEGVRETDWKFSYNTLTEIIISSFSSSSNFCVDKIFRFF